MRSFFPVRQPAALARLAALVLCLPACQVLAPSREARGVMGTVRAENRAQALQVAQALDELAPRVRALLPDAREQRLSVWIQPVPELYWLPRIVMAEADGFYAPGMHRIHLREGAEDIERTLAHELVHATLGPSWEALPGTLEEGLCDVVAAQLCPASAARLRAGRLSSAALALGSMELDLECALPPESSAAGVGLRFLARLRVDGAEPNPVDPLDVFRSSAGLSSAKLSPHVKKALYGLAGMVVQRLVDRHGIAGLHELCLRARSEGHKHVPTGWILEAAGLDRDTEHWRAALVEGMGQEELSEFVRGHPDLANPALLEFLGTVRAGMAPGTLPEGFGAWLSLPGRGVRVELTSEPWVLASLVQATDR